MLEEAHLRILVGQVGRDLLQPAARRHVAEPSSFIFKHMREVGFDPVEPRVECQPPRPRVESRSQVRHRPDLPVGERFCQQFVHESSAGAHAKTHPFGNRRGTRDGHATLTRQAAGEGIANQPVRPLRFQGAAGCHHQRRVTHVLDLSVLGSRPRRFGRRSPCVIHGG